MIGMYNDCLTPLYVPYQDKGNRYYLRVRCGKCIACKLHRTSEWMIRLYMESHYWQHISHLTLTYRNEDLPFNFTTIENLYAIHDEERPEDVNDEVIPVPSLDFRDFTLFIKRLRKRGFGENKYRLNSGWSRDSGSDEAKVRRFKYYACGEYGPLRGRSHYHLILFGVAATKENESLIQKIWGKGFAYLKPCFPETFGYVAGYVQKKLYGDLSNPFRVPEFLRASQGIGQDWFNDHIQFFDEDHLYIPFQGKNGKSFKYGIPRYFRKQLVDKGIIHGMSVPVLVAQQQMEKYLLEQHCKSTGIELGDYFRQRFKNVSQRFAKKQARRNKTGDI